MNIFRAVAGLFSRPTQNIEQRTNIRPLMRQQNFGGHSVTPISSEQSSNISKEMFSNIDHQKMRRSSDKSTSESLSSSHSFSIGSIGDLTDEDSLMYILTSPSSSPPGSDLLGTKNPPIPASLVKVQDDVKATGQATYKDVLKAMFDQKIIDKPMYMNLQLKLGEELNETKDINEIQKKLLPDKRLDPFYVQNLQVKSAMANFFNDTLKG